MKYESNVLKRLIDTYGVIGNPKYMSEIIKQFIVQGKGCFPHLFTYQADWLAHIDEFGLTSDYVVSYTGQQIYTPHSKEKPVKRAILKGSTKYRDIDTGEVLDVFEDGRNLELVSVKMPVLTTSNEDGTKTNILTVNEEVELRGIGEVKDELNLITGELTERIGNTILDGTNIKATKATVDGNTYRFDLNLSGIKNYKNHWVDASDVIVSDNFIGFTPTDVTINSGNRLSLWGSQLVAYFNDTSITTISQANEYLQKNLPAIQYHLATESVKTVDLTIKDQNDVEVSQLSSFNGGTHFTTSSQEGSLLPTLSVDVVTDLEETLVVCSLEGNTM